MRLVSAAADDAAATLQVASALAASGRRLDLSGLDTEIGKLCASVLDLPPALGRTMQHRLIALLADVERLARALDGSETGAPAG